MKTKQLVLDGMMAAMCAVLGYLALDLGSVKVTFESLPILLAALLFGSLDGMVVGGVGTLVYQLLRYGVTATTLLWVLPYVVCGLIVGVGAKKSQFSLSRVQTIALVVAAELVVTGLNTLALYVDSHLYGWYYPGLILGVLGLRLVICVVKAAAFGAILPTLADAVRRAGHRRAA
jgi:ECF transporter S component (folate family)